MSQRTPQILVVDKDDGALGEIRESLQHLGCEIIAATHSQQALDVAAREVLSLVICDRLMRTDTGVRLSSLIHSVPQNTKVPFLFTSPVQIPDVISRRIGDRNVFFIRKSFEHEAFAMLVEFAMLTPKLIRHHIQSSHAQQGLIAPASKLHADNSFPIVGMPHLNSSSVSVSPF